MILHEERKIHCSHYTKKQSDKIFYQNVWAGEIKLNKSVLHCSSSWRLSVAVFILNGDYFLNGINLKTTVEGNLHIGIILVYRWTFALPWHVVKFERALFKDLQTIFTNILCYVVEIFLKTLPKTLLPLPVFPQVPKIWKKKLVLVEIHVNFTGIAIFLRRLS